MKKLFITILLLGQCVFAKQSPNYFEKVVGDSSLKNHHINQYADEENPPQAFDITLPQGYSLTSADVESGGESVCSVTRFDSKTQHLTIEALSIETDACTCVVTLSIFSKATKKEIKVQYSIEQTGT